jgi:hypothetical protein
MTTDGEVKLDDARDIMTAAADFAIKVWHPLNRIGDQTGTVLRDGKVITPPGFRDAYRELAEAGWISVTAPKQAGGDGLPWVIGNALNELWSAANPALSGSNGLTGAAIKAIDAVANEHIRNVYLPPLVSGRWTGTMNLTEPQAGTDLGAIRTLARSSTDGTWLIKGQKIFITWGDHDFTDNIVHLVLARTPGAPDGLRGLSLFVVPKFLPDAGGAHTERNKVHTAALEHKLGFRASPTCVLDYDDATGFLVGDLHGGLAAMFVMMNHSRVDIGVQALGLADRAYQQARDYANERIQGRVIDRPAGTPIAEHPDVARLLMSMSSGITAMRALSVQVSLWLDEMHNSTADRQLAEFFVPILKGWLTETCVQITSDAIQVHGGAGFIEETGAAQHYRDARILPIYEGTTAVQANDLLGRKLVRDKGSTAYKVLDTIAQSVQDVAALTDPVASRVAAQLSRSIGATRQATDSLLRFASNGPSRDAHASAVAYLQCLGLLAGGWMHARILVAALTTPDEHTARRRCEADFYAAHHLTRTAWLTQSVCAGEAAMTGLG